MEAEDLQVTQAASGTLTLGEILITDTDEALDRLIQTKDRGRRSGEFTVSEAIARYKADGVVVSKGQMIQRLKRLRDKGKLGRRKVYFDGRRWTLFWWIK